ncbi:MAG: heme o synthase [Gammaproteobacteria bacterium]|nr:heme o synthase [Gammaproteobacteria bacterium]MCH9743808.1 heme o synthase [Gammaproteobacteria bacterium]
MKYVSVAKPGIIFGNIITVTGGFFLGLQGQPFNVVLFIATIIGMSLVMASGCVFNNCIDRDIDRLMERTKNRVLVNGLISLKAAIFYAIFLGIVGMVILACWTNLLTALVAIVGLFFYVVVYSLWAKRHSVYGTAVGGIAGAVPPVVGYCAVTQQFNAGAIILFAILFFWQMPHSYAIAIYRLKDYVTASIPVLPVREGVRLTKFCMFIFTVVFSVAAVMPFVFGYKGLAYLIVASCLDLVWLYYGAQGFFAKDDAAWARKIFLISILVITILSVMMIV